MKSNHPTGYQIIDFSCILAMSNEEFERIVGSMRNAETARKYRQVMKTKISQESKLQIEDDFEPLINHFQD